MTKRRKKPGSAPAAQPLRRNAPGDDEAALQTFTAELAALFDWFLAHGCPCRFPRFRATVSRDTREVGAPSFTTFDQQALVHLFDQRVALSEREERPVGHSGRCGKCGAAIERWAEEAAPSAWIDHLNIAPAAGVADLGAPVHTPVPHCFPFFSAARVDYQRGLEHIVEASYPRVSREDWLAWMRALLEPAQGCPAGSGA